MSNKLTIKNINDSKKAYFCYLFQIFFRRPFAYIVPIIYLLYLSVILIVVPHALHRNPLFVWTFAGIDMPVFNLFFIAAFSAVLAITIFRITREDGTELIISSKPITKSQCVFLKALVYLIIMLGVCFLCCFVTSLILPIFGEYNEHTNIIGITFKKYVTINLSVLIGNMINMFIFGGLGILFSLIGGQIITMVGCVGIVLFLSLVNFIYPRLVTTPINILSNNYGISIKSYSCNTINQYNSNNADNQINYATIECATNQNGEEEQHYDTADYWMLAQSSSNISRMHYFNIAKQLSATFNSFGMNETQINEAAKLSIGSRNSYKYSILPDTNISSKDNVDAGNYPVAYYYQQTKNAQGMSYPKIVILGGFTGLTMNNWYLISFLNNFAFDATSILSISNNSWTSSAKIRNTYSTNYFRMKDLIIDKTKWPLVEKFYNQLLDDFNVVPRNTFSNACKKVLSDPDNCKEATGVEYNKLTPRDRYLYIAKFQLAWAIFSQRKQIKNIKDNKDNIKNFLQSSSFNDDDIIYPFKTKVVNAWHAYLQSSEKDQKITKLKKENDLGFNFFANAIELSDDINQINKTTAYSRLVVSSMDYAETYGNLYQYVVSNYYDIWTVVCVWSTIAFLLFLASIIIYRRIDFK